MFLGCYLPIQAPIKIDVRCYYHLASDSTHELIYVAFHVLIFCIVTMHNNVAMVIYINLKIEFKKGVGFDHCYEG